MRILQVKDEVVHIEGADIIQHMIDHFLTWEPLVLKTRITLKGYDIFLGKQRLICYCDSLYFWLLRSVPEFPLVADLQLKGSKTPIGSCRKMVIWQTLTNPAFMKIYIFCWFAHSLIILCWIHVKVQQYLPAVYIYVVNFSVMCCN